MFRKLNHTLNGYQYIISFMLVLPLGKRLHTTTEHEHGYFIAVLHYANNVTCHSCDWFFWRIFPFRLYTRIFFFQSVGRLTEFLPYLTGHCCSSRFFSLLFCQKDFCPVFSITCKCKIKLLSMWSKSRSLLVTMKSITTYFLKTLT